MRRLCERPGCAAPAEVSYGIDNAQLLVWLDNSHVPERDHAGRLCRRHANALIVPRGWTVDDRRQPIPQLFRELERALDPEGRANIAARSSKKKPRQAPVVKQVNPSNDEPTLFEDPDETRAIAWSPATTQLDEDHDEPREEPVMGRLLGRAFRQPGNQ